jgi:hypothetical protein
MKKPQWFIALAAAALLASPQLSAQQNVPKASAGEVVTTSAKVVSVDQATREIVLEGSNGAKRTIRAGPDVRNLSQLKPGDVVTATYSQAVAVELKKGSGKGRSADVVDGAIRSKEGEKPGGVLQRHVTLVGTVEKVDEANRIVSVMGPGGNVAEVVVAQPTLEKVRVGDEVELVYTEALAIDVSPGR